MSYYVKLLRLWGVGQDPSGDVEVALSLVGEMQYHELYRQAADDVGITASDENMTAKIRDYLEVPEQEFEQRYREFLNEYRVSDAEFKRMYIEPWLLQEKLWEYIEDLEYPENEEYEHVQVQAMLLGTEEEALEIAGRWAAGEGFAQLAAGSSQHFEGWRPRGIEQSPVFDDIAFRLWIGGLGGPIRDTSYSTNGGYWLVRVLERDEEGSLHIQAILLDSKSEAEKIAERVNLGEDFAQLAGEYSLDSASKVQGGHLGWLTPEGVEDKFGQAVLALGPNELSEPIYEEDVSKQSGYWLIRVLDKDDRTLSDDHRDLLTNKAFNNWIEGKKGESRMRNYIDYEKITWALNHI